MVQQHFASTNVHIIAGRPLKIHLTDEGTAAAEELKAEA